MTSSPVPLIISTDMSIDVDDVGALCVAHGADPSEVGADARVQLAVDKERAVISEKIDAVSQATAATRAKQATLEERIEKMRGERGAINEYQEDLLQKLKSLELERKDAYSAAE